MPSIETWWAGEIDWSTPAGQLLKRFVAAQGDLEVGSAGLFAGKVPQIHEMLDRLVVALGLPGPDELIYHLAWNLPGQAASKANRADASPVQDVSVSLERIVNMIQGFCQAHLNEEYAALCRKPAEKLARKRPSPLERGQAETWACGIIRTIGWVNFLDDRSTTPFMKLTAIDNKRYGDPELLEGGPDGFEGGDSTKTLAKDI